MTHDMTKGSVLKLLVQFTLPLIAGNILQLTYNAVDSIIMGRCVGSLQLAAVGTSNPLISMIVMFMQGISMGTGLLTGNLFGAGEIKKLRRQVSTAMLAGAVFTLALTLLLIPSAPALLRILQVDEAILPYAVLYLRIVTAGLIFQFLYNYLAGTLRALGDSVSPLYFLVISCVLNIAGDLLLVVCFRLGVAGCAISTIACQALSCLLAWLWIIKKIPVLNMGREWLSFDPAMLWKNVQYGGVSAIQQSIVQAGILGVQGLVNSLGAAATAGFAAANRIDDFALIPGRNIANAMTSVMAQNVGAGRKDRVKSSFLTGMLLEVLFGITASILLFLLYKPCLRLFSSDELVLREGEIYLRLIALMYLFPALTNGIQSYYRGNGRLKMTLGCSILNMSVRFFSCLIYVVYLHMGIEAVPWACLTGWLAMLIFEIPLVIHELRKI